MNLGPQMAAPISSQETEFVRTRKEQRGHDNLDWQKHMSHPKVNENSALINANNTSQVCMSEGNVDADEGVQI